MEVADRQTILAPGDMLGCYRIDSFLGQGGFGVTYLAHDTMLDLQVAIKEYLPEKIAKRVAGNKVRPRADEDGQVFRRGLINFMKEARTLARFKHPNIVRVMSVFELNGTAYMVMEYERGHDLKLLFNRHEQVSEKQLKAIIEPIIDGLDEVHRHGFIHRDIKPANILVRDDGSPVLLDFGSARLAVGLDTDALTAMVTVGYAPLEQYSGLDEQQGPWTDIYALGAVLYCAITGQAPLDSTLRGAAVLNDTPDPLVPLTRLAPPGFSQAFCRAVDWALQFKVSARPQALQHWRSRLFHDDSEERDTQQITSTTALPEATEKPASTLSAEPATERVAADAPTTIKPSPVKLTAASFTRNGPDTTTTGSIEAHWDMSDISPRQRRRKSRKKAFPLLAWTLVLGAAAILVILKPWNLLQNNTVEDVPSSVPADIALAAETALSVASPAGLETVDDSAPMQEQNQNSTVPEAVVVPPRQLESLALNESSPTPPESPALDDTAPVAIDIAATAQKLPVLSSQDSDAQLLDPNDQASSMLERQAASNGAQLEEDRAVQRAEAKRLAELQARLAQDTQIGTPSEIAVPVPADTQARLALQAAASNAANDAAAKSTGVKPFINNSDMVDVLTRFNALSSAIERGDGNAMRQITVQSDRNYAYFDYVFNTFDKVEASVASISASRQDQKIRATLTISRMIRDNGDIAIPPEEFKTIPIYSVKEKEWSAIHW